MTTLADKSLLSGGDNKPPMLEKHLYDSWKSRMKLYMMNRPHGRMILTSVEKGPLVWPTITVDGVTRPKEYTELTPAETIQANFNTKFLNTLPAEWSKFVTDVKLVKDLHTTNVDQIHAHLEQHERHANKVRLMHERNSDPLALVASHQMTQSPYQISSALLPELSTSTICLTISIFIMHMTLDCMKLNSAKMLSMANLSHYGARCSYLRTNWEILFPPLFDELLTPPPSVDHPAPEVIAPIDEVVAPVLAVSTGSPSSTTVDQDAPSPRSYKVKARQLGGILKNKAQLVARGYRQEEGINFEESFAPLNTCLTLVTQWILPCLVGEIQTGMRIKSWKAIDPSHYRGMIGTLLYLTANADHVGCQDTRCSTSGSMQFLEEYRLLAGHQKGRKSSAISQYKSEYIALSDCLSLRTTRSFEDDALVPREQRLTIGSCNYRLSTTFKPKEPTFQVALDVLSITPFYPAFLITASVPARLHAGILGYSYLSKASHQIQDEQEELFL
ncbi:hypothetical protein Tco_1458314 [Tanacetum coccineum]